jgi:CDP-glycerol glycerophosphotransferase (TagB/SpsB family)
VTVVPQYLRGVRKRRRLWVIRAVVRQISLYALGMLDWITPVKSHRVVLGSDKGLKYSGNPKHLFEYLVEHDGWDVYWLTESPEILREVNGRFPGRALHAWSARALLMGLTSRWLCFSHSRNDLGFFTYLPGPRFVYLNHGTPLKTMGFEKAYHDPAVANAAKTFGALTCCSDFEATLWARAYRLPPERIWITGVPRNDQLFARNPGVLARLGIPEDRRVILFAPTYRETGALADYLPVPGLDGQALISLLERHNAVMLVRPHYYEWPAATATVARLGSDRFATADEHQVSDVNELLPFVDLLITDYSSIYFDYLLLDRPIIFSCHDRESYERERGFMVDYDANTPGDKVTTGGELLASLDQALNGGDPHRVFRRKVRNRFHRHLDNGSAERVSACIASSEFA